MSALAAARRALEGIAARVRNRAVLDLVDVALAALEGESDPVGITSEQGPLTDAERARAYRERKRHEASRHNVTASVTGNVTNPLALSSLSISSDPSQASEIPTGSSMSTGAGATPEATPNAHESRTQPVAKRARGSRVPASDASRDDILEFAISEGIDHRHPEWARFLDHWRAQPGQRGVKLDWGATWRNWIRRSAEYGPRMGAPTPVLPYHANPTPQRRTDGMRCELHGSDACDCERKGDTWRLRPAKRDGGPVRIGGAKP